MGGHHEFHAVRGVFVVRYPDLPRQGPEPDGDTVKFRPVSPAPVEALPRPSGTPPDINARGISVRLEAIDALETHFGETHQELTGANAARGRLLKFLEFLEFLGFTGVTFFKDHPNKVESADQDSIRGSPPKGRPQLPPSCRCCTFRARRTAGAHPQLAGSHRPPAAR